MTSKTERAVVPDQMPPEAPAELQEKRDALVKGLDAAAKGATGTLVQVLRVMSQVVHNCRPGAEMDPLLDTALREAFQRYEPEMPKNPWPAVLVESVEWMQAYLTARGFPIQEPVAAAPVDAAPAARGLQGSASRDLFEKVSTSKATLTGEVPVAGAADPGAKAPDGSLKNWQLNPGLGKVRG